MKPGRAGAAGFAALVCALYGPVARRLLSGPSDYTAHVHFAEMLGRTRVINHPHFLYQALVCFLVWLAPGLSFRTSGLLAALAFYALLGVLLYREAAAVAASGWLRLGASLYIILMQPIVLPGDGYRYQIGYLWPEPYYSPTLVVVKPLALIAVLHAVRFLEAGRDRVKPTAIAVCGLSVAAGALAKPNFAICLLPAAGVYGAWLALRKRPFSRLGIAAGVLVPGAAVLAWQYYQSYSGTVSAVQYRDAIVLAPFAVMRYHARGLAYKFLLSILFPVGVCLAWFQKARADLSFRFAWLIFAFGAFYTYMFAERLRFGMGNFLWCGYISCFVLLVMAWRFFLRQAASGGRSRGDVVRLALCGAAGLLHAWSGMLVEWNFLRYAFGWTPLAPS